MAVMRCRSIEKKGTARGLIESQLPFDVLLRVVPLRPSEYGRGCGVIGYAANNSFHLTIPVHMIADDGHHLLSCQGTKSQRTNTADGLARRDGKRHAFGTFGLGLREEQLLIDLDRPGAHRLAGVPAGDAGDRASRECCAFALPERQRLAAR